MTVSSFCLVRNPQRNGNWADLNSLTNGRSVRSGTSNNRDGRLNTECEINNRSAANLRSLNIPSAIGVLSNTHGSMLGLIDPHLNDVISEQTSFLFF